MKNYVYSMLKMIDFFGNPVRIYMRGKMKYNTALGGVFTLTIIALLVFFSCYFGVDMAFKRNPKLINYRNYSAANDTYINNSNFFMAYQILYPNNSVVDALNNKKYFYIESHMETMNKIFVNDTNSDKPIPIQITTCNTTRDLVDFEVDKNIKDYIDSSFSCLDLPNLLLVGSPFHSLSAKTLRINLSINYTKLVEDYLGNDMYLFADIPPLKLQKVFPMVFRFFYQSTSYDPNIVNNPLRKELAFADLQFKFSDLTHVYASFLRSKSIKDDSILLSSKDESYLYGFNDFKLVTLGNIYSPPPAYTLILKLFVHMDYYQNVFIRSYMKVQDVGAQVGAIVKIFFTGLNFITFFYTFNRINEQLAYKFFRFNPEKNVKSYFDFSDTYKNNELEQSNMNNNNNVNDKTARANLNDRSGYKSKIHQSTTTLPKIFINSIFNDKAGGNNINTSSMGNVVRKSINNNLRKMALRFNQTRLPRNSIRMLRRGTLGMKRKTKKEIEDDTQELSIIHHKSGLESLSKMKNENIEMDEIILKPSLTKRNKPTTRVIESSLRVSPVTQDVRGGKRMSYVVNNDKAYIVEGEDDIKINNAKVIKNFTEQDLIKPKEKLGLFEKIKGSLLCKNRLSPKLRMKLEFYQKAGNKIKERLDITHFLELFDEFQKFKILFLNPYQSLSLRYSKKANIFNINFNNVIDYYERFCNSNDHQGNIKKVMDYFSEKINNKTLDIMDHKILELLDGDLKKAILMNV